MSGVLSVECRQCLSIVGNRCITRTGAELLPSRSHTSRFEDAPREVVDPWDGLPVYPVTCRVWQRDEGAFALFELPFAPFVGLMIDQLPGDLTIEVTSVRWNTRERRFHIDAICDGGHANAVPWLVGKGWKPLEPPF